jgi:hypothetical protein
MRTVNYFGIDVHIPAHHIAISADPNGKLYSYDSVPEIDSSLPVLHHLNSWISTTSDPDSVYLISRVVFDDPEEWISTLRIYPLDDIVKSESLMSLYIYPSH